MSKFQDSVLSGKFKQKEGENDLANLVKLNLLSSQNEKSNDSA